MKTIITVFLISVVLIRSVAEAECKKHVELIPAAEVASALQQSEMWVVQNWKVYLWANQSPNKFPQVGQMQAGSRAVILEEGVKEYKVRSPLDKSEGWIGKIHVRRTLIQDTETSTPCN
jgi:hypothetical protein